MMNMEDKDTDAQLVTIHFEDNVNVKLNKLFLIEHSAYFEAMFNGNFLESQKEHIHIEDITLSKFISVINCIKQKKIIFESLEELLTLLEVSQLLQFSFVVVETSKIITDKYIFSNDVADVLFTISKLGMKKLVEKAYAYILYNFNTIFVKNLSSFLKLPAADLQLLLNNNSLNVDDEKNVFDLIFQWCVANNDFNVEYEMAVNCVRFQSMDQKQLEWCISKTKNLSLQNNIKTYMNNQKMYNEIMEEYIKPTRSIPFVLCAVKNELDGHSFVYRWDWTSMTFLKFIRLDPLPLDTTGYHVLVKDLDVYVMSGEVAYGRGSWNKEGWKYNLLSEKWTRLKNFSTRTRRHGIGYFVGDKLFLFGGVKERELTIHDIELFEIDKKNDTLTKVEKNSCQFCPRVDRHLYVCLEYKGDLAIITKKNDPIWFSLCTVSNGEKSYKWRRRLVNINEVIICATCYNELVYMLTYDEKRTINLYSYCPVYELSQKRKSFNIVYDEATTMCAFNFDKAMVFKNDILECCSVAEDFFKEYKIQLDSFYSNYLFSVPIYIEKTYY